MVAPASSLEVDGIQLAIGYLGVVTAFLLIGSPIPTFWRIVKAKQVGREEPYSYLAVLLNAATYVIYGIPVFADKKNKPAMVANGVGVMFELVYVLVFIVFVAADRRRKPLIALVFVVVACIALLGSMLGMVIVGHVWSRTYMGWIAMFTGMAMYLIPTIKMMSALNNADLGRLSILQPLAALANGTVWTAYAIVGREIILFTLIQSLVGITSALFQLIVWGILYWSRPHEGERGRAQGQHGGAGDIELPEFVARVAKQASCSRLPSSSIKETARERPCKSLP